MDYFYLIVLILFTIADVLYFWRNWRAIQNIFEQVKAQEPRFWQKYIKPEFEQGRPTYMTEVRHFLIINSHKNEFQSENLKQLIRRTNIKLVISTVLFLIFINLVLSY